MPTEVFRGIPQSLKVNAGIVPSIRPRPLPNKRVSFLHSLITLSLDGIHPALLKWSS
jgi:hypothetical protein